MSAFPPGPRRLLHLVSSLEVGGKERVVLDLTERAREQGHDHCMLLFDAPYRGPELDLDPGASPWEFEPRGPGLDLRFAGKLRRRMAGYEVVHAHNDTAIFYAALARCMRLVGRSRPRLVGTFHTLPGYDTPRARKLTRWATRRFEAVSAVSSELAERLVAAGWSRPCEVVWNGVDPRRYSSVAGAADREDWRTRLGMSAGEHLVGMLARFDPIKRQADLVEAVDQLRAKGLAVQVVFAGDGPDRPAFSRAHADARYIHVLGNVHNVAGLLAALDVFVLCSDHEAAPRALLEALAAGRACVVTEVGGIPQIVGAGTPDCAARLVPTRRPAALADALEELILDPRERERLQVNARMRAAEFGPEAEWRSYLSLWGPAPRNYPE